MRRSTDEPHFGQDSSGDWSIFSSCSNPGLQNAQLCLSSRQMYSRMGIVDYAFRQGRPSGPSPHGGESLFQERIINLHFRGLGILRNRHWRVCGNVALLVAAADVDFSAAVLLHILFGIVRSHWPGKAIALVG